MGWLLGGLRRWRDEPGVPVVVAGLVLASALVFGLAPRLLTRVDDQALRTTVAALSQPSRGIRLLQPARIGPGSPDPLAAVVAAGSDLEAALPATVRSLVRGHSLVVDTPRYQIDAQGSLTKSLLTLRVQPGALEHVRLVAGRAPGVGARTLVDGSSGASRTVYEVALSSETVRQVGLRLGDTIGLTPDARDPLATRRPIPAAAVVVGIFDVVDPTDPFWFGDTSLAIPAVRAYSSEVQYVDAIGLLSPDAYPRLFDSTAEPQFRVTYPFRVTWRLDVDPSPITAATADRLLADLRRLATLFPPSPGGAAPVEVRTDLTRVVGQELAKWRSASLILAVAGIGTATVGLAALSLIALLAARRRRQTVALWAARGASRGQLLGAAIVEAALVALPPAIIALALGVVLIPDGGSPTDSASLCLAVAAVTCGLLVTAEGAARAGRTTAGAAPRGGSTASRRASIEALVVVLAIAGAYLLRQRAGPTADATGTAATGPSGPDPFIAAVPALVGVAAGLVAARAFRLPVRGLATLASRAGGLVPVLGFRRSSRTGTAAAMLLVLMATTTVGTFVAATLGHLDRASAAIAWHDVGADFHVSPPTAAFPPRVDLGSIPGVAAVAAVSRATVPLGVHGTTVVLLAVDPAALAAVTAGTPADTGAATDLGVAATGTLPAIVSPALAASADVSSAAGFEVSVAGDLVRLRAVREVETFPTIPLDQPLFAVVSRPLLEAATGGALPTTDALVRAPGLTAHELDRAIEPQLPSASVAGRAETEAAVRHSPIVDAVAIGIVVAAVVAAAYAAAALVAALALASSARATEAAHLRTLGLSRAQSVGLVVVEHLPAIGLAFLAGTALGLASFAVAEPGLGLAGLLGSTLAVPLVVDPAQLLALLGMTALVTASAMVVAATLERNAAVAPSVRRGIG